jgi:hypothetical protein
MNPIVPVLGEILNSEAGHQIELALATSITNFGEGALEIEDGRLLQ